MPPPTPFTKAELNRLTQILESLNESVDAAAQRQWVTRAFRSLARGNEIAGRLRYSASPHTFAVGVIDDLDTRYTQLDGQKTLAVLIQYVADDILIEGDDVDFLRGLLSRYFNIVSPSQQSAPDQPPIPGSGTHIDTGGGTFVEGSVSAGGPFIGRDWVQQIYIVQSGQADQIDTGAQFQSLRDLLAQMQQDDRVATANLLDAIAHNQISQSDAAQSMAELQKWAEQTSHELSTGNADLRAQLDALAQHSVSATGYLQASLPIIPGILSYNVELGSQHTLDLKGIVERIKGRFRLNTSGQAKAGL